MSNYFSMAEFAARVRPFLALLSPDEHAAATRLLQPGPDMLFRLIWLLEAITLRHPNMLDALDSIFRDLAAAPDDHGALWRQEARARQKGPS